MSFPKEGELSRLKRKLRHQKIKLRRLQMIENSSIWEKIELRLQVLNVIGTQEKIDKLISEMVNSNN